MPYKPPGNRAFGYLASAYVASSGTLTLGTNQGNTRWPVMAAGDFFEVSMVDESYSNLDDNFQLLLCTARSSDTLTVVGGQEGTTDKNFPRTTGTPQQVKITGVRSVRDARMMSDGGGAIIQATAPALNLDSARNLYLTPAADITVALPTTGVWAGRSFRVYNLATPANPGGFYVIVNSSGGNALGPVPPGCMTEYVALQDVPTTAAHWAVIRNWKTDKGLSYVSTAGTSGADGTAQTVKSLSIKANTLTAVGQWFRVTITAQASGASAGNLTMAVGGGAAKSVGLNVSGSTPLIRMTMDVSYVDNTHANISGQPQFQDGEWGGANVVFNDSGYAWNTDQSLVFAQSSVASRHWTVYQVFVEPNL